MSKYMVERLRMLLKWREYVVLLKKAVDMVLPGSRVYVVGAAEDRLTAISDIDVVIVYSDLPNTVRES